MQLLQLSTDQKIAFEFVVNNFDLPIEDLVLEYLNPKELFIDNATFR